MIQKIDHIVYAVEDLHRSIEKFVKATGLEVFEGGKHPDWGTHNAIVRIDKHTYLEFLAKDKSAPAIHTQTWMGLDLLDGDKITRWSLASQDVESDKQFLRKYNEELATIIIGSRMTKDNQMLNWLMTAPLPAPEVEAAPFLIDWKKSAHPTNSLPLDCSIKSFTIEHDESEVLKKLLEKLDCAVDVYTAHTTRMTLVLDTPKGEFVM